MDGYRVQLGERQRIVWFLIHLRAPARCAVDFSKVYRCNERWTNNSPASSGSPGVEMGRSQADACILELGERLGMPGLRLDAAGCCQLLFDARWLMTLAMEPDGSHVWLHCPCAAAHATDSMPAATLVTLLKANFMGHGAGGATLAAGADGRVYLQRQVRLSDSGASGLCAAIEQVLDLTEKWAERISHGNAVTTHTASTERERNWLARRV